MPMSITFGSKVSHLEGGKRLRLQLEETDPLSDQYMELEVQVGNIHGVSYTLARLRDKNGVGGSVQREELDTFRRVISQAPISEEAKDFFLKNTTSDSVGV